jgi:cytoskeletal protein RodZ
MHKKSPSKSNRRNLIIGTLVAAALIVAIGVSIKQIFGSTSTIPSTTSSKPKQTSQAQGTSEKQNNSTSSSSDNTPSEKSSSATTNITLLTPTGSFVSNHRPSLSSTGSPSSEQSVCNTTPGATCEIRFTKGNDIKKLPTQSTDTNGSTYWNWDVKSAGFTTGTWSITAYATLNGKTLSAPDAIGMEVIQ